RYRPAAALACHGTKRTRAAFNGRQSVGLILALQQKLNIVEATLTAIYTHIAKPHIAGTRSESGCYLRPSCIRSFGQRPQSSSGFPTERRSAALALKDVRGRSNETNCAYICPARR
ncbi:MAG: hypothetical protein MUP61_00610, partial [Burkholderiales bacterium]|nr:hypothetical protein [Burkholderiales bacterium]